MLLKNLFFDTFTDRNFPVSNGGRRFMTRTQANEDIAEASTGNGVINVVESWFEQLKHIAPPSRK